MYYYAIFNGMNGIMKGVLLRSEYLQQNEYYSNEIMMQEYSKKKI